MPIGKRWSSMSRRVRHQSGRELWTHHCRVPTISRRTVCGWSERVTRWLRDLLLCYFDREVKKGGSNEGVGTRRAMNERSKVIIIGGGFGGLCAARALKGAPVDVTLIDR